MPSRRWSFIFSGFLGFSWSAVYVAAQQSSFQWGFNDWTGSTLPKCQLLTLFVNDSIGTVKPAAPYFLVAYEDNGLSTTSAVGDKVGSLSWTVNHPAGSKLVLVMFDANGNSGGVLFDTYTVAGDKTAANSSCITTSSPTLTIKNNSTSKINTCDSVTFSISGGRKPYTVTVAETNSEVTNNSTMGAKDDVYTWVNNLSPGNQVIISIFDQDQKYGISSNLMTLAGSSDTHCSTSSTSSTNSTSKPSNGNGGNSNDQSGKGNGNNNNSGGGTNDGDNNKTSSKTGIIAGIVIAAFFVIFFGLLAWFFLRRRKNKRNGGVRERNGWTIDRNDSLRVSGGRARLPSDPSDSDITPFALPTGSHATPPMSARGYSDSQASPFVPGGGEPGVPGRPSSHITDSVRGTYYQDYDGGADGHNAYAMDAFRMSTAGSGSGSQGRSAAQESSSSRLRVFNEDAEHRSALRESAKSSVTQNASAQQQRQVFQHQDAGAAAIDEIPPAYPGPATGFP